MTAQPGARVASTSPTLGRRFWRTGRGSRATRGALVICLLLIGVALGGRPATGQEALHHAGLIVRHGDGRVTYADVAFPEETISGIDLLRRSGIEQVTIPFGGLGVAVCSLEREGCPAVDCRRRLCQGARADDPYWQYFRQTAPGQWRPLTLGASATKVHAGDIDGWSWTGGDPRLPAATIADVVAAVGLGAGAISAKSGAAVVAIRTIYPPGTGPSSPAPAQSWPAYAGGAGILVAIAAGGIYGARRRRHATDRPL
jgi:hypothetical protein